MTTKKNPKIKKQSQEETVIPEEEHGTGTKLTKEQEKVAEPKQQIPDDQAAFRELLVKFRVGLGGDLYETIVDDIATTGGEFVFERPDLLTKKLLDWNQYINAPTRKKILEYWFVQRGIPVSKEMLKEASMDDVDRKNAAEEKHHDEKYSVDTKTGVIKMADKDDKSGLSWGEAEKLSERVKADLAEQQKQARKDAEGESKDLPFVLDENGNITVPAGAKLSGQNLLILQAIKKSEERGEKRSAREILEEEVKHQEFIDSLRGKGQGGGGLLSTVDEMLKAKELFATDSGVKEILTKMSEQLTKIGTGTSDSPKVELLSTQITELTKRLEDQEKQTLRDQIASQNAKIEALDAALKKQGATQTAMNEFGIMSKVVDKVDSAGKDLKETVLTLLSKPAPPMPEAERAAITEAIGTEATKVSAKQELGAKLFTPLGKGV